jgi:hypothetical protein
MTTMTIDARHTRVAGDGLRRELQLGAAELPPSAGPTGCGVAAITVDPATGEVMVVCVCTRIGWGRDETVARADLEDAHRTVALP